MTINDIRLNLIESLTPYLKKTDKMFDEDILSSIVDGVLLEAESLRRYPSYYTDEQKAADMAKGLSVFRNVALSRYNKVGVEFQSSHSEGEVSDKYVDFGKEWSGWLPLAVM